MVWKDLLSKWLRNIKGLRTVIFRNDVSDLGDYGFRDFTCYSCESVNHRSGNYQLDSTREIFVLKTA